MPLSIHVTFCLSGNCHSNRYEMTFSSLNFAFPQRLETMNIFVSCICQPLWHLVLRSVYLCPLPFLNDFFLILIYSYLCSLLISQQVHVCRHNSNLQVLFTLSVIHFDSSPIVTDCFLPTWHKLESSGKRKSTEDLLPPNWTVEMSVEADS